MPTEAGLNRFVWDLTWPAAGKFPGMMLWSGDPVAAGGGAGDATRSA